MMSQNNKMQSFHWYKVKRINSLFSVIKVDLLSIRFCTFLLLHEKECAFSLAFLCVHIRTNQAAEA